MDPTYPANNIPLIPVLVVAGGFVAAVGIGSLAWFNSKRPAGWENADRPGYMPQVAKDAPTGEDSSEADDSKA